MKKDHDANQRRNDYLRILLNSHRSEIRADMLRLRDLRRRRGEILFINQYLDSEMHVLIQRIEDEWTKYRQIMGFDIALDEQDRARVSTPDNRAGIYETG